MRRLAIAVALVFAVLAAGCGSKGVTIESEGSEDRELSPEEQRINEHLQEMMENPLGPPPGVEQQQEQREQ